MSKRMGWILAVGLALTGCSTDLARPSARVTSVTLTEQTPRGARVEVTLAVANPNDTPLPVASAAYEVEVAGLGTFRLTDVPPMTLEPNATQTFVLPAAFDTGGVSAAGRVYQVQGDVDYVPPGEIRELLTQYHVPLPSVPFAARGMLLTGTEETGTADERK